MQGNRQANFEIVKKVVDSPTFTELSNAEMTDLAKYAVTKGANQQDVVAYINKKNSKQGGLVDINSFDFSKMVVEKLESAGKDVQATADDHGSTIFFSQTGLIPRNRQFLIPIDAAYDAFLQQTGIDLRRLKRGDKILQELLQAHIIDQAEPLVAGGTYKTRYGNSVLFQGQTIGTAAMGFANILAIESLGVPKFNWNGYFIDRLLIPNDILYKLNLMKNVNPQQKFTYPVSAELAGKVDKNLYSQLKRLGVDSVIDPLQFRVARGREWDGPSVWVNSKGGSYSFNAGGGEVNYQNGVLDAYEEEGEKYLRLLREQNDPQAAIAKAIFRNPEFIAMPEKARIDFVEGMLNVPSASIDRKDLYELYNRAELYNMIDRGVRK